MIVRNLTPEYSLWKRVDKYYTLNDFEKANLIADVMYYLEQRMEEDL